MSLHRDVSTGFTGLSSDVEDLSRIRTRRSDLFLFCTGTISKAVSSMLDLLLLAKRVFDRVSKAVSSMLDLLLLAKRVFDRVLKTFTISRFHLGSVEG